MEMALAVPRGLEPLTFGLGNRCSVQLSYGTAARMIYQIDPRRQIAAAVDFFCVIARTRIGASRNPSAESSGESRKPDRPLRVLDRPLSLTMTARHTISAATRDFATAFRVGSQRPSPAFAKWLRRGRPRPSPRKSGEREKKRYARDSASLTSVEIVALRCGRPGGNISMRARRRALFA